MRKTGRNILFYLFSQVDEFRKQMFNDCLFEGYFKPVCGIFLKPTYE